MSKRIILSITFLLLVVLVVYVNHTSCNKPGSIAEKINWGGNNCEKPAKKNDKIKEIIKEKTVKNSKKRDDFKNKKMIKKWLTKYTEVAQEEVAQEEVQKEVMEDKYNTEKSQYDTQVEIDDCYEEFYKKEHMWWEYDEGLYKCKSKELVFLNCSYMEDGEDGKHECLTDAATEALAWVNESRREYFKDTPEEIAAKEEVKESERVKLKNTIKEAIREMGEE